MTITATTFREYQAIEAVNWSTLREMSRSPLHYLHAVNTPRPDTPAMRLGRAVHCAILEPDSFDTRHVVWDGARRGNDWRAFAADNAGREILTADEHCRVMDMRDALRADDTAAVYFSDVTAQTEVTATWRDPPTGLPCKARLDWLRTDAYVDLKTTRDADAHAFGRTAARLRYHCQMAMQGMGLAAVPKPVLRRAVIVAVESEPPHDVAVYELSDDDLYAGEREVAGLLARVACCRRDDHWPGRYAGPQPLQLPAWASGLEDGEIEVLT